MIFLAFGDFDLIFKVIVLCGISYEPVDGFSSNLHRYIIVTCLSADYILGTLT